MAKMGDFGEIIPGTQWGSGSDNGRQEQAPALHSVHNGRGELKSTGRQEEIKNTTPAAA